MIRWTGGFVWFLVCVVASQVVVAEETNPADPIPTTLNATELNNSGITQVQAGRWERGIAFLRRAITLYPKDTTVRKNLSLVLTDWAGQLQRQQKIDLAITTLQEAHELDSTNGIALIHLGDLLYFNRSDMAGAIEAWKKAYPHIPGLVKQSLTSRIAQARQDQQIEHGFLTRQSEHFDIRYQQSSDARVGKLEPILEDAYHKLSDEMATHPSRITVIVYTDEDLRRTYYQRDWAIGFYDGRIRLRIQDLDQTYLQDLVVHELTHAFLHQLYPNNLPIWLHEGFAQLHERDPETSEKIRDLKRAVTSRQSWIPLSWLDSHFQRPSSTQDIARAYIESRFVVQTLMARYGIGRLKSFFKDISEGTPLERAYEQAFSPSRWVKASQGVFD